MERQLIKDYAALIDEVLAKLAPHNHALAVELAAFPKTYAALGMSRTGTSRRQGGRSGGAGERSSSQGIPAVACDGRPLVPGYPRSFFSPRA